MIIYFLVLILIGAASVLQGGLNKQITESYGILFAILLNSSILLFIVVLFTLISYLFPSIIPWNENFRLSNFVWKWWYFIPAVCGFLLITGIPILIPKVGALGVFFSIVIGQMVFSLLWDLTIENIQIDPKRVIGVLFAFLGLIIANWSYINSIK